ncbi:ABC transporter permease [Streptomyces sp. NPDC047967]|uniref:ABC transporter permease n=1 Tax=Streptomyces sp. NPDC047967 TaxID=3154924 RepID=UPI0034071C7D
MLSIIFVEAASSTARESILLPAILRDGKVGTWSVATDGSSRSLQNAKKLVHDHDESVSIAFILSGTGAHLSDETGTQVEVTAYMGDLLSIRPFAVRTGHWPSGTAKQQLATRVVINEAAMRLGDLKFKATDGSSVREVNIVATVDDGVSEPQAWVPAQDLEFWAGASAESRLQILARGAGGDVSFGERELSRAADFRKMKFAYPPTRVDTVSSLEDTLQVVRKVFFYVGAVTLGVGAIGILNVGLATVKERTEEIALRRSLGATRRDVAILVLFEYAAIGAMSSIIALALGWLLFTQFLPILSPLMSGGFPLSACFAGLAAGSLAGLCGGAVPAVRASRIPISTVMRA